MKVVCTNLDSRYEIEYTNGQYVDSLLPHAACVQLNGNPILNMVFSTTAFFRCMWPPFGVSTWHSAPVHLLRSINVTSFAIDQYRKLAQTMFLSNWFWCSTPDIRIVNVPVQTGIFVGRVVTRALRATSSTFVCQKNWRFSFMWESARFIC